uniref:centrosomal protein of 89 kDa-like n=1 Tax=Osmia lignaria TaxID=473952 RepID=UPI00147838FE|nr:centrosomal protein of 89 kDa-like [Osmia lignaria]
MTMTNYEGSTEQQKKKHSCRRTSLINSSLETPCRPVYCRRRISKAKHTLKSHVSHKDPSDYNIGDTNDNDDNVCSMNKKHDCERNKKSHEKSHKQSFDEDDVESGTVSSRIKTKHPSKDSLRIANEYHKLEKRYKHIEEECKKLGSILEQRETEYKGICSHYETLVHVVQELEEAKVDLTKHNEKLEAEKVQLNEDILLLKNIVYQLNTELERYQDKLRDQKLEINSAHIESSEKEEKYNQRIWGSINFHALGPLLNAYQENLSEKRELLRMYEQEMADFGNRCKEVLTENELMHKEVQELRSECDRYAKEIATLVENTASLKKQNDILEKDTGSLKRETAEVRSAYELKMGIILKRNDVLRKENMTCVSELSNLRGKYEILSKEFEKLKSKEDQTIPTSIHTAAVEECKKLLDELKYRYENEKRNLSNHIKRMEENQPENEKELVMAIAERNHLKGLVENLEKNLKRTQRKLEHVQGLVYSTRISRDSLKGQLSKATAYCEELFSEYERIVAEREKLLAILRETEQENANIDRLGKSITSRVNDLKNQLEIVRKGARQQVESAEKRIKLQELRVQRMKRICRHKVQHLSDIIKQKEDIIGMLQKEKHGNKNSTRHELQTASNNVSKTARPNNT